jgi:photosystem II stability/assembly factor-like uncharacterized protein
MRDSVRGVGVSCLRAAAVLAIVLAAVVLGAREAAAGENRWTVNGPEGGGITALAAGAPGTVFAATSNAGLFKSVDAGTSWQRVGKTEIAGHSVVDVKTDPSGGEAVYAATAGGLFRSPDGGASWSLALAGNVDQVAVAPSRPQTIYATVLDEQGLHGVRRSVDGGATWRGATGDLPQAAGTPVLVVSPASPQTVYLAAIGVCAKTTDAGAHWSDFCGGLPHALVETLVIVPGQPNQLFAGTPSGVFASADGGASWTAASGGLTTPFINTLALDPRHPSTLYAGADDVSIPADDEGLLWKSVDGGASWARIAPRTKRVAALLIDPQQPRRIYAGVAGPGVLRSEDRGATWNAAVNGLRATWVTWAIADPHVPGVLYAATQVGDPDGDFAPEAPLVVRSSNFGATWSAASAGLPVVGSDAAFFYKLIADPATAGKLFALDGSLYLSEDSGATWQAAEAVAPGVIEDLAVDPRQPALVFAVGEVPPLDCPFCPPGSSTIIAWESRDGGRTWTDITARLAPGSLAGGLTAVRIDPKHPARIYLAGQTSFKSLDGGASWTQLSLAPGILDLAIDPETPTTLYAHDGSHLWKSLNAGATWLPIGSGLPTGTRVLNTITLDLHHPATVYLATNLGVYLSHDAGATFQLLTTGLTVSPIANVVSSPTHPGLIYASTAIDGGLFSYTQAPPP